jgi:16S rRNA processing protein RimM
MLAAIAQPHGVSGRMKVKSFTTPPAAFADYDCLTDESGNAIRFTITSTAQGMPVIAIDGVTSREEAERWRGRKLGVAREAMKPIDTPNEHYIVDLIGCAVTHVDGGSFGTVSNVMNFGAGDIVEIQKPNGESELYSFTQTNFPSVDTKARALTINPPEMVGLKSHKAKP